MTKTTDAAGNTVEVGQEISYQRGFSTLTGTVVAMNTDPFGVMLQVLNRYGRTLPVDAKRVIFA